MKTVIAFLTAVTFVATPVVAQSLFDGETDVTNWKMKSVQKEFGNEKFRSPTKALEVLKTWSFDQNKKFKYQCDNSVLHCAAVYCEYGKPALLITDPANRGYKIRFWSMDYENKKRAPLTVASSMFGLEETTYIGIATVKVNLTKELVRKMVFGDTFRLAYSFPLSDQNENESPNDIYVHMESFDGPFDPESMFDECAETTNLKTE